MKFEIKSRWNGLVLFALETESLKLCVEAAVKAKADLSGADLSGSDLSGSDLSGSDLRSVDLRGSNLIGSNLRGSDLSGSDLSGSDLSGSDLRGSDLSGSDLRGSDLIGADLSGSDLSGSDLSGSDLRGSDLSGSDLSGAYLSGAGGEKITAVGDRPYLTLGPIGSRADMLQVWLTSAGVYVRAGCFWDTLDAFKAAVDRKHGDSVHGREYRAAIALIECHAEHWTPKAETQTAA